MGKLIWVLISLLAGACTPATVGEIRLPEPTPLKVETVTVIPKPVAFEILCDGVVRAGWKQELYFHQSGRLWQLRVWPGAYVRAGDTLAIMENRQAWLDLQESMLRLEEASYAFESAMMSFHQVSVIPDTIRKSVWHSSGLAMAETAYARRELAWRRHFLLAEKSGKVAALHRQEGEHLDASGTFGMIYNPAQVYVEAHVLELHASRIGKGMAAGLRDMYGRTAEGRVVAVDPWVDEDGFFRVRIKPDSRIGGPGSHLSVTLFSRQREGLVVPVEAVMSRSGRLMVYVVKEGTARWQYIEGGMQSASGLEVVEGLQAGDTVIIDRLAELGHGVSVEVSPVSVPAGR